MFLAGLSFCIGGSYMVASGDVAEGTDGFSLCGGGGLYGGWTNCDFALSADIDHTSLQQAPAVPARQHGDGGPGK